MGTGLGTREAGGIDRGDDLSPAVHEKENLFQEDIQEHGPDPGHELRDSGEMRNLRKILEVPNRRHQLENLRDIAIILVLILLRQEKDE